MKNPDIKFDQNMMKKNLLMFKDLKLFLRAPVRIFNEV